MSLIRLDAIKMDGRARTEVGDIDVLAKSIAELGLLQPIIITQDAHLLMGTRRIMAVERLGWETIPFATSDSIFRLVDLIMEQEQETTCRLDKTASERLAAGRRVEQAYSAEAKWRRKQYGHSNQPLGPGPNRVTLASRVAGYGQTQYSRIWQIKSVADNSNASTEDRKRAIEAMRLIDRVEAGEVIYLPNRAGQLRVGTVWRHFVNNLPSPLAEPLKAPRRKNRPAEHKLSAGLNTLSGLVLGFQSVEEIPEVSPELYQQWDTSLSKSLTELDRLKRRIRAASNRQEADATNREEEEAIQHAN